MKSRLLRVLPQTFVLCFSSLAIALTGEASAADGAFTSAGVNPLAGGSPDANIGLNANKTYDAAVDVNGAALSINGVAFTTSDADAVLSGAPSNYPGFVSGVSGTIGTLLGNFSYGGNPGVVTLNNLTAGQTYIFTAYNGQFGNAGARVATVSSTTSGTSATVDENKSPLNLLRYTFTATGTSEVLRFQQAVTADSWHFYGFSSERTFNNSWVSGGNWSTATWGTPGVPNSRGSNATFASQGSPTTITMDATQTVGHIQFDGSNSWTVNGSNALTLQSDVAGISVLAAKTGTHTISAPVTFASDVMKCGPGTIVLSGAITDAGKNITLGAGSLEIANASAQTLSGIISGTGNIAKSAAGTLTVNRPSTYSGNTVITGGTLKIATQATVSASYVNASSYTFTPANDNLLSGKSPTANTNPSAGLEGTGGVGILTDGSVPAFTFPTSYTVGNNTVLTYSLGSSTTGYDITAVNLFTAWQDTGRSKIDITSITYSTVDNPTTFVTLAGSDSFAGSATNFASLTASGGVLAKRVGTIKFNFGTQQNNYVGYRELEVIGTPSATNILPSTTPVQIGSGATLDLAGLSQTVASLANSGANGGAVSNSAASTPVTFGVSAAGGTTTFSGAISDSGSANAIGLTKSGAGTQVLSGTNNYTGITTVSGGILQFAKPSALYNSTQASWTAANITVASGGTLAFNVDAAGSNGFTGTQLDAIKGIGTSTTGFTSGSALGIDTSNAGGSFTYASPIGDTNSNGNVLGLTKLGTGTLILTGANTNTGTTTISAGTLQVSSNGTTATLGSGNIVDNASLVFNRANAITVANTISGSGTVSQTGAGTLNLTGSNSYAGTTIFAGGTVNVASFANYGANSSLGNRVSDSGGGNVGLLFQGGTLQYTGSTAQSTNRAIRISTNGGATLDASGSNSGATLSFTATSSPDFFENGGSRTLTLTGSNTGSNTFGMAITEAGGLTSLNKNGLGTWVLTGANTYGGQTNINAGTLRIQASNGLGAGGFAVNPKTTIANGAALEIDGSLTLTEHFHLQGSGPSGSGAIRNISGSSSLTTNFAMDANSTFGVDAGTLTIPAQIYSDASNPALTKVGAGTLVLSGNNQTIASAQPMGAVTVNGGTLTISGGSAIPNNSLVTLANTSGVVLNVGSNETIGSLAGGGANGGNVTLGSNTLTVGDDNTPTSYAGIISGINGALIKSGTGTLTLTGSNTYTGTTTVTGGELAVTGNSILDTGNVVLNGGKVNVAAATNETIGTLYFGNISQPAGTYGSTSSSATYKDDTRFSGTGIVTVGSDLFLAYMDGYPTITGGNRARSADPDGDGLTNLQEWAFGTDPSVASGGAIAYSGGVITANGQPTTSVTNIANGVDFRAVFGRRKDYIAAGLTYTVQFSAGLNAWVNSNATPTIIASDSTMDAVTVPYPFFIPTTNGVEKPTFFRVAVSSN